MVSSATYDSGYEDIAYDVAIDGNGNVFVTGFKGNGSNRDYLTMKYDPNLVMISSATYDEGSGDDEAHGIAIDGNGNVFVTGFSSNAAGGGTYDYYTIKYDNNLNYLTNVYYDSSNTDYAYDVAVDTSGKVFVTGATFNGADYDFFTAKYTNDLSLLETSISYDGGDVDKAKSIVVDRISGDVFVTGESYNGVDYDYFTIKYDNGLVVLSSAAYNGGSSDYAKGIVIDNTGNVIVTGQSLAEYFTIKYSNNLVVYSSASYSGGTYDTAYAVAVGTSGYIYVTGASDNGTTDDFRTIRYSLSGDETPPAAVTDLSASTGNKEGEIELDWSMPGDDGWADPLPPGSKFAIQYATYPTPAWMYQNAQVQVSTYGVIPNTKVSFVVTGLTAGVTYYFKIWHADEVPNWSLLSNGATNYIPALVKSAATGNWDNPSTWSTGYVPWSTQQVEIQSGHTVTFNRNDSANTVTCSTITIKAGGTLCFDGAVSSRTMTINGNLNIYGSFLMPPNTGYISTLRIKCESNGQHGIIVNNGGIFNVQGNEMNFWRTTLSVQANSGQNQITTTDSTGWKIGDVITIATSDSDKTHTEERTITGISGTNITLNSNLDYTHNSGSEVVNISRNCVITSATSTYKAYIRNLSQTEANFNMRWVEASYLGSSLTLLVRGIFFDAGTKGTINYSSIHHGGRYGISLSHCSDVAMSNNSLYANSQYGIKLSYCSDIILTNNSVSGTGVGIEVWAGSSNTVKGNNLYSNTDGLVIISSSCYNSVYNNELHSNSNTGITIDSWCNGNIIRDNNIYSNAVDGFDLWNSCGNTIITVSYTHLTLPTN